MTRLSKGERPLLLYLLILPYLVLRFFLFDKTDDAKTNAFLTLWRVLTYAGLLLMWVEFTIFAEDPPPTFNNADVFVGEVVFVAGDSGGRRGSHSSIALLSGDVKKKFRTSRFGEYNNLIKQQLGSSMTIWSYKRKNLLLMSHNYIIEMEINGRRLWNDWPEVKKNIETANHGKWMLFWLLVAISPFYKIWKLLTKKTNSD